MSLINSFINTGLNFITKYNKQQIAMLKSLVVRFSDNPRIKVLVSALFSSSLLDKRKISMASFLWQKQSLFVLQRNQLFYVEKSKSWSVSNEVDIITCFWFFFLYISSAWCNLKKHCPWFLKTFVDFEIFWKIKKALYAGFSCIQNILRTTGTVEKTLAMVFWVILSTINLQKLRHIWRYLLKLELVKN